ncbi:MAG: hypothetical protein LBT42_08570, partial [Tannerella sp.]|nr:hypothetical protein [Tannerella sp.]
DFRAANNFGMNKAIASKCKYPDGINRTLAFGCGTVHVNAGSVRKKEGYKIPPPLVAGSLPTSLVHDVRQWIQISKIANRFINLKF